MRFAPHLKLNRLYLAVLIACLSHTFTAHAEGLNTTIPVTVNLPAQPLAEALKQYAKQSGKNIVFDNSLAKGKFAPAVKGNYEEAQILRKILENSGLEAQVEDGTIVVKREREKLQKTENIQLDPINVRAKRFYEVGPLPGLGLTKEQIPGNVQSITAKEIKDSHSLSITDLMNKKLQSVTVNDYQGNPFQMDVQYRGFTAGPQIGTPQGLSVFFDGIRVNEPFGDVVNWDMIPMNALAGVDVFPGSNPIFGLNTLGGAFTLKTKDGFNNAGVDAEVLTGSFGRKQLQVEGGVNNGTFALFGAGNFFLEDGWRENSPSKVNQLFTKASYRGDKLDLNLSSLWVGTDLVGNGLLPSEEYARDRNAVFTSPDTTKNRLQQFQLSGSYFVNDKFTITGQVYRRSSKRQQKSADVYTDYDTDGILGLVRSKVKNTLLDGEEYTCLYNSTNKYGLPDYYVYTIPHNTLGSDPLLINFLANGILNVPASEFEPGNVNGISAVFNADIPDEDFVKFAQYNFLTGINPVATLAYTGFFVNNQAPPLRSLSDGTSRFAFFPPGGGFPTNEALFTSDPTGLEVDISTLSQNFYVSVDGAGNPVNDNYILFLRATNSQNCATTQAKYGADSNFAFSGLDPADRVYPDGASTGRPGVVEGIPTAQIINTQIDQIVDGASMQLNWSLDKHKVMVGASIDIANADYESASMLGLLDSRRNAFLAPDQILEQYLAARQAIKNNDFSGTSTTKSLYASETWSPIDSFHLTGAIRYNETKVKNELATRSVGDIQRALSDVIATADLYNVCRDGVCPSTGLKRPDLAMFINPAETEEFTYRSFNPALGATWQAEDNLNLYANWSQGTRVPSVIELGCAIDKTLVPFGGPGEKVFKSIAEGRSCNLPSTLSGDPYLPQIRATTYEIGARGNISGFLGADVLEWNLSTYLTNLKDDIYLITLPQNQSLFDSIGKTRRQGIEAGFSGTYGKAQFKLNYALTDATFQDTFVMASNDNSSALSNDLIGTGDGSRAITVKPGNRMPGVSLHNLNASFSFDVTPKWQVGLSAVMHSDSYVRGNENNKHQVGVTTFRTFDTFDPITNAPTRVTVARQPTSNPGKVPGYTVFNFQTSYKFNREWTASILVNNLFDKEYFSAGRLGRNPFSPSILGAVGPDGYNHNSNDWLSTNFIAPGAPRGIWFSLNWQFDPNAKPSF